MNTHLPKGALLLPLLALAGLLVTCTDEEAERKAEARAALDALRQPYEARQQRIQDVISQAQEHRQKAGVPELQWGDRPAPTFLDVEKNRYDREANGRIYELNPDGELNTDPMSLLGSLADSSWRDEIGEKMAGEGYLTKGGVQAALEKFMTVRYLCLILTDEYQPAEFGSGSLFQVNYHPAAYQGRALYFDLEDGQLLGGRNINVRNPDHLEFKTSFDDEDRERDAHHAAQRDLQQQIEAIVRASP